MSRKSNAQIEAESALQNLTCIVGLAEEARQLEGNREANTIYIHHNADCRRWLAAMARVSMPVPLDIATHFRGAL